MGGIVFYQSFLDPFYYLRIFSFFYFVTFLDFFLFLKRDTWIKFKAKNILKKMTFGIKVFKMENFKKNKKGPKTSDRKRFLPYIYTFI